ncbi:MAG: hypothetical protein AMXMBFR84_16740 [Candidatus Hydrogenedentota bacterium]
MPTFNRYRDGRGYYIRSNVGGYMCTFQLEEEGINYLIKERGLKVGDKFDVRTLNHLVESGWAYTGGSGATKVDLDDERYSENTDTRANISVNEERNRKRRGSTNHNREVELDRIKRGFYSTAKSEHQHKNQAYHQANMPLYALFARGVQRVTLPESQGEAEATKISGRLAQEPHAPFAEESKETVDPVVSRIQERAYPEVGRAHWVIAELWAYTVSICFILCVFLLVVLNMLSFAAVLFLIPCSALSVSVAPLFRNILLDIILCIILQKRVPDVGQICAREIRRRGAYVPVHSLLELLRDVSAIPGSRMNPSHIQHNSGDDLNRYTPYEEQVRLLLLVILWLLFAVFWLLLVLWLRNEG